MRTSDHMIVRCMGIIARTFSDVRSIGASERDTTNAPSAQAKDFINERTRMCRIALDCLRQDVGDEKLLKALTASGYFLNKWWSETMPIRIKPLVNDEMKKKIFDFIDAAIQRVDNYCNHDKQNESYDLYNEMDRIHNVPSEIYSDQTFGNLINK